MKKKSILIFLLAIYVSFFYETVSHAISLELNSSQTDLSPKDSLTVNIIAKDAANLSGALLLLEFPESIFKLEETPVTTDFFESQSLFNSSDVAASAWAANTETKGEVYLAGVAKNDDILPYEVILFSIHFSVKTGVPVGGTHVIRLSQSSLCNGPAGWGTDKNNNGKYNPGDAYGKAPMLYTITADSQTGQQIDSSEVRADVLLETLTPVPSLFLTILSKGEDSNKDSENNNSVDECPYDPAKLTSGDCGCGVPDTDSDGDGVPNCFDIIIGPVNGATNVSLCPLFEIAPYPDFENAGVSAGIVWQISRTSDFSDLMFEMTGEPDQSSLQLPEFILDPQTTYFWRILYSDGSGLPASWDAVGKFTTGFDDTIDFDENGIPDHQDAGEDDNMIVQNNPGIDETDLMVVKTATNGFQYGLVPGDGVAGIDRLKWLDDKEIDGSDLWPVDFPFGLITFRLYTEAMGDTVTIKVYFLSPLPGFSWWKYDCVNKAVYDNSHVAAFSDDMMSVVITIEDGGDGDADGVANGVIVAPGGLQGELDSGGDTDDEVIQPSNGNIKKK